MAPSIIDHGLIFIAIIFFLMLVVIPSSIYIKESDYFTEVQKGGIIILMFGFLPIGIITFFLIRNFNNSKRKEMENNPDYKKSIVLNKLFFETRSEQEAEQEIIIIDTKLEVLKESYLNGVMNSFEHSYRVGQLIDAQYELKQQLKRLRYPKEFKDNSQKNTLILNKLKIEGLINEKEYRNRVKLIKRCKKLSVNTIDEVNRHDKRKFNLIFLTVFSAFFFTIFIVLFSGFIAFLTSLGYGIDNIGIVFSVILSLFAAGAGFMGIENDSSYFDL